MSQPARSPRAILSAVNVLLALVIIVVTTALAVGAMLAVRRRAPEGSYFSDGDRAAGVFGVLATGFAVLLGFVVFLAFTSYDSARAGAESEARIVAAQLETAQLFPADVAPQLTTQLVCYARSVAGIQWKRMQSGSLGEELNPWGAQMFRTLLTVQPETPTEEAAYSSGWTRPLTARRRAATGSTARWA